jgi:hypothetical protein
VDLKIEIRNLYALHQASLVLEHGIREILRPHDWRPFSPSRFVYAFFTFNGMYSYDWDESFRSKKAVRWSRNEKGNYPSEQEQFKAYLKTMSRQLGLEAPRLFAEAFVSALPAPISQPGDELRNVSLVNASREMKNLATQMHRHVARLHGNEVKPADLYPTLSSVMRFVYLVRCNLFHGAKTRVRLQDAAQQSRLEVYAALLVATNSLLFHAAGGADIGWIDPEITFGPVQ